MKTCASTLISVETLSFKLRVSFFSRWSAQRDVRRSASARDIVVIVAAASPQLALAAHYCPVLVALAKILSRQDLVPVPGAEDADTAGG